MNTIIRPATHNDLDSILAIYNDAIAHTTAVYEYQSQTMDARINWFEDKLKNNVPVLVADRGNIVAGFISYGPFRAWKAYKYTVEHSIYVHPDHRQQGIAKKLLTALLEAIKEKEIHTLIAGIDAENAASIHLHRQFGFEEIAHFKQVGYKFGKWLDLKFYQLVLQNKFEQAES
jgi:L-amino acid N-acyltransferase